MQSQIHSQETDIRSQEDELSRTKMELSRLQEEEAQLEQSLLTGRVQLDSIIKSLKTTQEELNQVSDERRSGCHFTSTLIQTVLCAIKVLFHFYLHRVQAFISH